MGGFQVRRGAHLQHDASEGLVGYYVGGGFGEEQEDVLRQSVRDDDLVPGWEHQDEQIRAQSYCSLVSQGSCLFHRLFAAGFWTKAFVSGIFPLARLLFFKMFKYRF